MRFPTVALTACCLLASGCGDDGPSQGGCDPAAAGGCPAGQVCQPLPDGTGTCTAQCDPAAGPACADGNVCEARTDGLRACYLPVRIRGRVFDPADDSPVEGALVTAADETGAAATDVAVSAPDGSYSLTVPVERAPGGTPAGGVFTLRAVAQDYEPFPRGVRVALPIDAATDAVPGAGEWIIDTPTTDIGLIPLPPERRGLGSIAGTVRIVTDRVSAGGVLMVAEAGAGGAPPMAWTDLSGRYRIFNVPAGTYEVHGYKALLQVAPWSGTIAAGEHRTGADLLQIPAAGTATISGSVNIVDPRDCDATSVVVVPESAFDETLARGEVVPGLRAPAPGTDPSVTGAFTIGGVPDGRYVVLAAFENDFCVRDPDPGIAGTLPVHVTVPDPAELRTITIDVSFKVTGALRIVSPGATAPEEVAGTPTFRWADDSSEQWYSLAVYDALGTEVWRDDAVPRVTSGDVEVPYGGPALEPGMYYQFRATSVRDSGPISATEDLLGVFFPAP